MDPFARQARQYVLSRPSYPKEFILRVLGRLLGGASHVKPHLASLSCLDVGCGSGQLTVQLAEHFGQVVGVDRSQPQLDHALKHPRVSYAHVSDATDLSRFPSASFDCLTIAQALHWLPLEPALSEFHRVLKPGGLFVAMGYGCCNVDNPAVQDCLSRYYVERLGSTLPLSDARCLWDCDRTRLDSGHAKERFEPPFEAIERTWHPVTKRVSSKEFLDYLKTWSAYQKLIRTGQDDPLREIEQAVTKTGTETIDVTFPFWLITGLKAQQQQKL